MQIEWLSKKDNDSIIVFFMGWACDKNMLDHIKFTNYDVLIIYDYNIIDSENNFLSCNLDAYKQRVLVAWSFGVWIADKIYSMGYLPKFDSAIAINGTLTPVDNQYGIPKKGFELTIKGLQRVGMTKFYDNICSDKNFKKPSRDFADQLSELKHLYAESQAPHPQLLRWTHAVVGMKDLIFPAKNVINFWQKYGIFVDVLDDMEHYPFTNTGLKVITNIIRTSKTQSNTLQGVLHLP